MVHSIRRQSRHALQVLVAVLAGAALSFVATSASAQVRVVATLPDLCALAAEVGGSHVDVTCLVERTEDPHFVDARPSAMVALSRADLLVMNGAEFEIGWLPSLQTGARNPSITDTSSGLFDASTYAPMLETNRDADRSQGDVHASGNPHFVMSPVPMISVVNGLRVRLAELDPTHADDYAANAQQLVRGLQDFADAQSERFSALSSHEVVTYHASLTYLIDWLGLSLVETLEPLPGVPPNPGHVADVVGTMRGSGAAVIVQEAYYPRATSDRVAGLTSARVVVLSGGADVDAGQTYLQRLQADVDALYDALDAVN